MKCIIVCVECVLHKSNVIIFIKHDKMIDLVRYSHFINAITIIIIIYDIMLDTRPVPTVYAYNMIRYTRIRSISRPLA